MFKLGALLRVRAAASLKDGGGAVVPGSEAVVVLEAWLTRDDVAPGIQVWQVPVKVLLRVTLVAPADSR